MLKAKFGIGCALFMTFCLFAGAAQAATTVVHGTVWNANNGVVIGNASVSVYDMNIILRATTKTGSNGYYNFTRDLRAGAWIAVRVVAQGYTPQYKTGTISPGGTYIFNFAMAPLDKTAPIGSIFINNGASATNSGVVTLYLFAQDNAGGSGMSQMQFSNNTVDWSSPEAYAPTKTWAMNTGEGSKIVYVKFKDAAGNISSVYSDFILLDTIKPALSIISPANNTQIRESVNIKTSVSDSASGVDKVEFYIDGSPIWQDTASPYEYLWDSLQTYDGAHEIKVTAYDKAGNTAQKIVPITVDNAHVNLKAVSNIDENNVSMGAAFYKNANQFFVRTGGGGGGRGINMAVLHSITGEIEDIQNFDNWYSSSIANPEMVKFIDNVPQGHIIMTAIADHGSYISEPTYQKFESIGSKEIRKVQSWDNWAMITKKGFTDAIAELYTEDHNICSISATLEFPVTADHNPPAGSFLINNGASVAAKSEVELNLAGINDYGSGMGYGARMKFSNDGQRWSTAEKFAPAKKWYLERGDGQKTVYAKFADVDGNWSAAITRSITLQEDAKITVAGSLNGTDYFFGYPSITKDSAGNIYSVWVSGSPKKVLLNYSRDKGLTWLSQPKVLTPQFTVDCQDPKVVHDNQGHVYVVWNTSNYNTHTTEIYFVSSNDYGATWNPNPVRIAVLVAPDGGWFLNPNISCDNRGNIYVAWVHSSYIAPNYPYYYFFNHSGDYGRTWQVNNVKLSKDTEIYNSSSAPQIFSNETGEVFLIWYGINRNNNFRMIYYNCSYDYGATWLAYEATFNNKDVSVNNLKSLMRGKDIYVIWAAGDGIYFQHSADSGKTWLLKETQLVSITPTSEIDYIGRVTMADDTNGNIYLAWTEAKHWKTYPNRVDIYFGVLKDKGMTWLNNIIRMTHGPEYEIDAAYPAIACDSKGGVYLIWEDNRNYIKNNPFMPQSYDVEVYRNNIYFNYSKDYGSTWQNEDIRLDKSYNLQQNRSLYESLEPNIVCDEIGNVFTVWNEGVPYGDGYVYCDTRNTNPK